MRYFRIAMIVLGIGFTHWLFWYSGYNYGNADGYSIGLDNGIELGRAREENVKLLAWTQARKIIEKQEIDLWSKRSNGRKAAMLKATDGMKAAVLDLQAQMDLILARLDDEVERVEDESSGLPALPSHHAGATRTSVALEP